MLENLNPARKIEAPKDFRPALEFDGENGWAITPGVPANEVPNFDQFLLEQGFDPAEYEIVGAPRTSRWQKYDGDWLTSYRFNFRKIKTADLDLQITWKLAKGGKHKSKEHSLPGEKALVVMLADFQVGKVDSRGGTKELLERFWDSLAELKHRVKTGKYDQVILCDMGDIVEGFSNKADMQQTYSNDLSIMQQVDLATAMIWEIVKALRPHPYLTYATVASNHCQFRLNKQQVGKPGLDDWGVVIAQQIDRLARETGTQLRILVPEPSDESLALDVFDDQFHVLGLWHGHQSARPEAVPQWWEKQAFGNQPVAAATIGLTGHFHHLRVQELGQCHNGGSRYWIQGKSLDSGSSWFRLNQGSDSSAGITCFELEKQKHFTGAVFHV